MASQRGKMSEFWKLYAELNAKIDLIFDMLEKQADDNEELRRMLEEARKVNDVNTTETDSSCESDI